MANFLEAEIVRVGAFLRRGKRADFRIRHLENKAELSRRRGWGWLGGCRCTPRHPGDAIVRPQKLLTVARCVMSDAGPHSPAVREETCGGPPWPCSADIRRESNAVRGWPRVVPESLQPSFRPGHATGMRVAAPFMMPRGVVASGTPIATHIEQVMTPELVLYYAL